MEIKTYVEQDKYGNVILLVLRGKTTCKVTVNPKNKTCRYIFENNKNT